MAREQPLHSVTVEDIQALQGISSDAAAQLHRKLTEIVAKYGPDDEASGVDESLWLMGRAHYKPVIEICGGTEIGSRFVAGSLLQSQSLSAFSTAAMGSSLFILGEDGSPRLSIFKPLSNNKE